MATWDDFSAELDRWAEAGSLATFWWRDDDAEDQTPELLRLFQLAEAQDVTVLLAVIPEGATIGLEDWLFGQKNVAVGQHGFAHINHAPEGQKKAEFGAHRTDQELSQDLLQGRTRLSGFDIWQPIFVPPWNRMSDGLAHLLGRAGLRGLSTYQPRKGACPAPGITQVNCHMDPIDWRGTRGFLGDEALLDQALSHMTSKRDGIVDADEPTGLLTHHLVTDKACWTFLETFMQTVSEHPGAAWLTPTEAFFGDDR
ncbi:MAG: polysaccharide deacetylase family protein [Magnetovibrionaceae bacterium]